MKPREILLLLFLLGCVLTDLRERRIRLFFAGAMAALGAAERLMTGEMTPGAALPLLPGLALSALGILSRGAVGAGDGILLTVCGIFLGPVQTAAAAGLSFAASAVFSGVLLAKGGRGSDRFPFAPFLAAGVLAVLFCGE